MRCLPLESVHGALHQGGDLVVAVPADVGILSVVGFVGRPVERFVEVHRHLGRQLHTGNEHRGDAERDVPDDGDAVHPEVVEAIAEGRRASYAIDAYLQGQDLDAIRTRQTLAEPQPEFLSIVPYTDEDLRILQPFADFAAIAIVSRQEDAIRSTMMRTTTTSWRKTTPK